LGPGEEMNLKELEERRTLLDEATRNELREHCAQRGGHEWKNTDGIDSPAPQPYCGLCYYCPALGDANQR
jgi:hypothetical protein